MAVRGVEPPTSAFLKIFSIYESRTLPLSYTASIIKMA